MAIADKVCAEHDERIGGATVLESSKLKEADAIRKLSKALGAKFLHFYVYGAVEGEALVMYLSHPAMVQEFKGQKEVILEEMRVIYAKEKLKGMVTFRDVRVALKPKPAPVKESKEAYRDKASGNFDIRCEDAQLKKIFEKIQQTIREGHDGNRADGI